MKDILVRLKSPVVISNIVAAVIAILINLGVIETGESITTIVNLLVGILIAFGVLNNPTDPNSF